MAYITIRILSFMIVFRPFTVITMLVVYAQAVLVADRLLHEPMYRGVLHLVRGIWLSTKVGFSAPTPKTVRTTNNRDVGHKV
jgi:hypothetical protein